MGVTARNSAQNGVVVSRQQTGWRKATASLVRAEKLAESGAGAAIAKSRALVAVKRVGAHIGLKAADLMLLDTLAAFSQPQDWEAYKRPIVWPSNAYLIEQTGFSLSALKRHVRRLTHVGVLSFHDSPNGKRWGKRDRQGNIVEAYGFDLAPLAARAEEFEALYEQITIERSLCARLRRQITVTRRMIRACILCAMQEGISGPWESFQADFDALLARLPRGRGNSDTLSRLLQAFDALHHAIRSGMCQATGTIDPGQEQVEGFETAELAPREVENGPHIPITNQLQSITCNKAERETQTDDDAPSPSGPNRATRSIDLPTMLQACPEFVYWGRSLGHCFRNWEDISHISSQLTRMMGIAEYAWTTAKATMGMRQAAIAVALVFEKHATGEITSPGGYLRGMTKKAAAGEMCLARSLFGRLRSAAA